jgi:CarD family transcriptional regulator
MLEKGSYVVNTNNGICEISDIVKMNMTGEEKEYYVLVPIEEKNAKVFVPVAIAEKRVRPVMKEAEAWTLIKEIKAVDEALIENEREREKVYKEAINSRDPKRLISIIKTIYIRRKKRLDAGKKTTTVDDRYFKLAENNLYSELAFSLGVKKEDVNQIIEENTK